jgi:ketosteroid isomerase-like protein
MVGLNSIMHVIQMDSTLVVLKKFILNYTKYKIDKFSMRSYSGFLFTTLLIGLIACQSIKEPADMKQEIEKVSNEYLSAVKSLNVEQVLSFWMEDLVIYRHSAEDVVGKNALREILEPAYKAMEVHEVDVILREIDVSGNIAVEFVEFSEKLSRNGGDVMDEPGRYISVWKKTGDGWKIRKMITLKVWSD